MREVDAQNPLDPEKQILPACIVTKIELKRKDRGISVAELARRIGMDGKRLWYVLHGQREMRVEEFIKLCAFFDLGLGCFIDRATVERLRSSQPFRE